MITFEQLNRQNEEITELSNVLEKLLEDRFLCDSKITQELFFRYVDKVSEHLALEDKRLFPSLLRQGDSKATMMANRFMGGSKEIKRIFSSYLTRWCEKGNRGLAVGDFAQFRVETREMFEMVLNRIQDETERLYPALREITGDAVVAA